MTNAFIKWICRAVNAKRLHNACVANYLYTHQHYPSSGAAPTQPHTRDLSPVNATTWQFAQIASSVLAFFIKIFCKSFISTFFFLLLFRWECARFGITRGSNKERLQTNYAKRRHAASKWSSEKKFVKKNY